MSLETRLNEIIKKHPDSYNRQVVRRVREFIRSEDKNHDKYKHFRIFKDIDDWILYHRLHPEWQGMSPSDINRTSNNGIKQFYDMLLVWCKLKVKGSSRESKRKRNMMTRQVLQYKKPCYRNLKTLYEWIKAKQDNPEWRDATSRQMQRNEVEGGNAFYRHCKEFVESKTESKLRQREMMAKVFKPKRNNRNYTRIDDWKDEYEKRFAGYSVRQLETNTVLGGRGYVYSLRKWLKREHPKSPRKRSEAMRKIFKNYSPNNRKSPKR